MALGKTLVHYSGVSLQYWRITRVEVDALLNSTTVMLSGYTSAEARAAGKRPLSQHKFVWVGANNPITPQIMVAGQAYQACYTRIKSETVKLGLPNPTLFVDADDI